MKTKALQCTVPLLFPLKGQLCDSTSARGCWIDTCHVQAKKKPARIKTLSNEHCAESVGSTHATVQAKKCPQESNHCPVKIVQNPDSRGGPKGGTSHWEGSSLSVRDHRSAIVATSLTLHNQVQRTLMHRSAPFSTERPAL